MLRIPIILCDPICHTPSSAAKGKQAKQSRAIGNQVIRKGWLSVAVSLLKGSSREFWFVLSSESVSWFKDSEVSECIM